jgi:hypothetical protein
MDFSKWIATVRNPCLLDFFFFLLIEGRRENIGGEPIQIDQK